MLLYTAPILALLHLLPIKHGSREAEARWRTIYQNIQQYKADQESRALLLNAKNSTPPSLTPSILRIALSKIRSTSTSKNDSKTHTVRRHALSGYPPGRNSTTDNTPYGMCGRNLHIMAEKHQNWGPHPHPTNGLRDASKRLSTRSRN